VIRHRDVVSALTLEEATRYTPEQRSNLRSWGIDVPEPALPPEPQPPPPPLPHRVVFMTATHQVQHDYIGTTNIGYVIRGIQNNTGRK
jgi:hypothetical protein